MTSTEQAPSGNLSRPVVHRWREIAVARWVAAHWGLWLVLLCGWALKAVILTTDSVTFDADEAIVALMARHITQGARPLFFYGQDYMGALDAYLVALSFMIFGQTVFAVRVVQIVLYLGVLGTTYGVTYHLTEDRRAATAAGLLVALPPVLFTLYTTATLGDYVEILLLNNLLLWIGWNILGGRIRRAWGWLLWGVLAGLGWWGMALIVTMMAPVGVLLLWHSRTRVSLAKLAALAIGFGVGAFPWMLATAQLGVAATVGDLGGVWINPDLVSSFISDWPRRLMTLVVFNLPALFGLRPPWSVDWIALPIGVAVTICYLAALWRHTRRLFLVDQDIQKPRYYVTSLLGGWVVVLGAFVLSPFGRDPTGRYLLTLYPLLAILFADWVARIPGTVTNRAGRYAAPTILAICLGYNVWGNVRSIIENPPGLTTQFDLVSHIPHDHDDELIAFLDSIGVTRGYSNYWVTYRFAFLTHERIIMSPSLPYKLDMSYTYDDDRYPLYTEMVWEADRVVYITTNHPILDKAIRDRLEAVGVTYRERQIGPYHIFYDMSRNVSPLSLAPFGARSGKPKLSEEGRP